MEHKHDAPSSFPIGVHTGSCGKQEAMEQLLKQQAEQQIEIVVLDPQKEEETLASLLQKE